MPFQIKHHPWKSFMKVIHESHIWQSSMKVIYESHPWKSSMTVHVSQIATVSFNYSFSVSCGGHLAYHCFLCPIDVREGYYYGKSYCGGDCRWEENGLNSSCVSRRKETAGLHSYYYCYHPPPPTICKMVVIISGHRQKKWFYSLSLGKRSEKKTVDVMNLALFPFGPPSHHK